MDAGWGNGRGYRGEGMAVSAEVKSGRDGCGGKEGLCKVSCLRG